METTNLNKFAKILKIIKFIWDILSHIIDEYENTDFENIKKNLTKKKTAKKRNKKLISKTRKKTYKVIDPDKLVETFEIKAYNIEDAKGLAVKELGELKALRVNYIVQE